MASAMQPAKADRRRNRRTALILASVVLVFFLGVIARRWLAGA